MSEEHAAEGCRILVVEDEMTIVLAIEDTLRKVGARIVGPASRLDTAIKLATEATFDAAILDVNIRDGASYPVADILSERGIPFVFCSGYSDWALEERHRGRPRLAKPYTSKGLEEQILQLLSSPCH